MKTVKTSISLPEGLQDSREIRERMKQRYAISFSQYVTQLLIEEVGRAQPEAVEAAGAEVGS